MKLKVVVISALGLWDYGPRWEIFSRFAEWGHEVHYISPFREKIDKDSIYIHSVRVPFIETCLKQRKIRVISYVSMLLTWFLFMLLSFIKGIKVAKEIGPSIVYGYEVYGVLPAYLISKIFGVPMISRLQGTILYPKLGKASQMAYFLHILAFKIPSHALIITNDGTYGDLVARILKVPDRRVRFWRNGVDKNIVDNTCCKTNLKGKLGLPAGGKIVISVCRLEPWKGVHRLIRSIPAIVRHREDVFFVIVGDGSERARLEQLARELGVIKYVRFVGHVPHSEIPQYLAMSSIYVTLQDLSCLSASLTEAMICGKCIVALQNGDFKDVLKNGENCILVTYADLDNLHEVLLRLLDDDQYRMKLGENARKHALNIFKTWEERARNELSLILSLSKRKANEKPSVEQYAPSKNLIRVMQS